MSLSSSSKGGWHSISGAAPQGANGLPQPSPCSHQQEMQEEAALSHHPYRHSMRPQTRAPCMALGPCLSIQAYLPPAAPSLVLLRGVVASTSRRALSLMPVPTPEISSKAPGSLTS